MEFPIKKSIFAATNPTTPLNDAYHGGTSLFIKVYEIWNSKAALELYYLRQSDISEGSPCRTCKDYEVCRIPKQVCYRDIVRKYGTKHWDYPDVNCPKSL